MTKKPKVKAKIKQKAAPTIEEAQPKPKEEDIELPQPGLSTAEPEISTAASIPQNNYLCGGCKSQVMKGAPSCSRCGMALNWAGVA